MNEELYDLPTSNRNDGAGTFAYGTVTKLPGGYHLSGASEYGYNFQCFLDDVYIGYQMEPALRVEEEMDVTGLEFRLGDRELHLRESRK